MTIRAVILSLAACFLPVSAGAFTADDLFEQCNDLVADSKDEPVKRAYCAGFLRGIVDAYRDMAELGSDPFFCLPEKGVGTTEVVSTLNGHLKAHPDHGEMPGSAVLMIALRRAYPCEKAE